MTAPDQKRVDVVARALCASFGVTPDERVRCISERRKLFDREAHTFYIPHARDVLREIDAHDAQQKAE